MTVTKTLCADIKNLTNYVVLCVLVFCLYNWCCFMENFVCSLYECISMYEDCKSCETLFDIVGAFFFISTNIVIHSNLRFVISQT